MQIGAASRPMPGETECGDGYFLGSAGSAELIAVVDGLGHGPLAAHAARAACRVIDDHRLTPLPELMRRCDHEIRETRGAAVALLRIDAADGSLEHVGVGNVEVVGRCLERIGAVSLPGIVGRRIRRVLPTTYQLHPGDRLAVFTDGISRRVDLADYRHLDAQGAADNILAEWAKSHDDATCVVISY